MSVFERGGTDKDSGQSIEALLEERLNAAVASWEQPRERLAQSVGKLDEESGTVQILQVKGKMINSMGFAWKGRKHLFLEEAMFLVDQGYLLLFREDKNQSSLLSWQDTHELMVRNGVSLERYLIYSDLKNNGYVVLRHPLRLRIEKDSNPRDMWKTWGQTSTEYPKLPALIYQVFKKRPGVKQPLSPLPEQYIAHVSDDKLSLAQISAIEKEVDRPVIYAFESNTEIVYYSFESHTDHQSSPHV